ncbi:MAG: SMP-30/gluconolactonase/LRE family protein [Candidatus Binataceae bacterium]
MLKLERLLGGLAFPEGPRWHHGVLYFSDMHDYKVMTVDLNGKTSVVCEVPQSPSGLGWLPDGRMLVVSMNDRRLLRLERDGLKLHADISKLASFTCNDMVVDGKGRAYVGNFGFDLIAGGKPKPAEIVLVEPDGAARIAASNVDFPNGSVITSDGRTLIVGESFGRRLTAFDIQSDGSLANRRLWADIKPAVPDGIALDAENAIWVASPITKELLRVFEGGRIAERIACDSQAIACALGGADRKTLFALLAESINPDECRAKRSARIDVGQVEVPGAGWP